MMKNQLCVNNLHVKTKDKASFLKLSPIAIHPKLTSGITYMLHITYCWKFRLF
jgi:hypothetical protein